MKSCSRDDGSGGAADGLHGPRAGRAERAGRRVARHVGMDGVGEALRTGVLFAPPPQPPPPPGLPPTYQPPPPSARARRGGRPGDAADDDDENLFEIPVAGDANGGMSLEQLAEL